MELKSIKKKFNGVLTLVLTIAALTVGQSMWAASTFTVTNTSGTSKFVITRTSNTSATETVNYRTVSLSAIAGQHFTDKTGTLTFDAIHNSREVEVTENTPGTDAYKYQNGTSRKYRFEVLDQGGFRLAYTDRTITTGTSVPSSNAFAVKDVIIQTNEYTADDKGYDKNGYKSVSSSSFFTSSNAPKNYLKHIGAQLLMTLSFQGKENDDAYEYLQLLFNETTNCDGRSGKSNGDPGDPNLSSYMAGFEMNTGTKDDTYRSYTFPILDVESGGKANDPWGYDPTNHKWPLKKQNFKSGSRATDGRIIVPMDFSSIVLRLNASGGSGSDEWAVKNVKAHIQAVDGTAPSRLGDPVISGSMHAKGNTFYVSVPFDEIVTVSGTPTLSTTWGSASYVSSNGGSGSNVLTFSGTITASAGKALTVNSISGTIKDLAGNELSSAGKAINKNIGTTVDANHTFTITYDLADGTVATANPDNYTYETATFTLNNPIHTGYAFAGWTGSNGNTPQTTVTIPAGSHGDKTFTANWTPIWGQDNGKTGDDEDHAYVISSTDGLDMLAKVVNGTDGYTANTFEGKFFKLGADITYTHISEWNNANSTENNYTAIGRLSVNKYYTFMGTFDGDGYTVSGIRIYKKDATDANGFQGLFGRIGEQGIVRNITLDDSRITGDTWSGGIAGNSVGTVDNCHVTDQVLIHTLSTGDMHGGIAGRNSGLLQNSTSAATLSANSVNAKKYGGIAGYNLGTVQNCLAVGTSISSQNQYVGAIVGVNDGGTLVSNYYRNCTVGSTANAINVGVGGESSSTDQAGARSVHTLTLVDGVTASGESVIIGSYTYYASNTTVTLGYSQAVAQQITYHYNDGSDHDITGNTFTMPASDVTISVTFTAAWSGAGTKGSPYLITTPEQLDLLAKMVNGTDGYTAKNFSGTHFKLGNNIEYTGDSENYTAIGSGSNPFNGTFNGDGKVVSGIRINQGGTDYHGLFGHVGSSGTVKNVILADAVITGGSNTGAVVGNNAGTLSANYYHDCTVNNQTTNIGTSSGDCNGTRSVHALTLPADVTTSGESVEIGSNTYYASNTAVTLGYSQAVAQQITYHYNDGSDHDITGNTFTMPASDVTISVTFTTAWSGAGTKGSPYLITTPEQLDLLAKMVNGTNGYTANKFRDTYFRLDNDITYTHTTEWNDANSTEDNYTAIGKYNHSFGGVFDGGDHTISGIRIYMSGSDDVDKFQGLFGVTFDGTVKNVTLTDARITGYKEVGGIIGAKNYGLVENCHVTNTVAIHAVVNNSRLHGGIVGYSINSPNDKIRRCTSAATISIADGLSGCDNNGGIVGRQDKGTIENCLASGANVSGNSNVGAIVGYDDKGTYTSNYYHGCTVNGTINATNVGIGSGDQSGARSVHTLTLSSGITATGESVEISSTTYYAAGTTVTLGYTGTVSANQIVVYSVGTEVLSGNSFTMTAADATVSAEVLTEWEWLNRQFAAASTDSENPTLITLDQDYTAQTTDGYLTIPSRHYVTLDLNGHTLNRNLTEAVANGFVIKVEGTLTINDSSDPNTGSITGGYSSSHGGGVYMYGFLSTSTFIMNGGNITGNNASKKGGGVYVDHGSFTMNGGTISNNTATNTNSGGGVYVSGSNGVFNMTGGTICGNTGNEGAGVFVGSSGENLGSFTLSGGTICDNRGSAGGGVYSHGNFTMSGGNISNNIVSYSTGGGVYIGNGSFNISGSPVITGNIKSSTSSANNVYLKSGKIITVIDALTNTASIGVTMQDKTGAFTTGLDSNGTAANFTSDASAYLVYPNDSGEAALDVAYSVNIDDGITNGTVTTNQVTTVAGTIVTLIVTPSIGYSINTVSYNDGTDHEITAVNDVYSFTMPAGNVTVTATFSDVWGMAGGADGTVQHPYTITTTAGLDQLATLVNSGNSFSNRYFRLGGDITYSHKADNEEGADTENNFTPIGGCIKGATNNMKYFSGTFDGQGHTVRGIRIYKGDATIYHDYQGLFGLTLSATIKNVILADARITGRQDVGGIAGYLSGTVENCRVGSDVTIHAAANVASTHGGVVGNCSSGTIRGCVSTATLTVADGLTDIFEYGGIVGCLNGNMSDCLAIGATVPAVSNRGSIVGDVHTGSTRTNNYYHACTVGASTHQSDAYTVSAGTDVTVAPAGDADATYDYNGIKRYGDALYYGGVLYAPEEASVSLTLGYNGSVPTDLSVGYAPSTGSLSISSNPYTLTMSDGDVTINAFFGVEVPYIDEKGVEHIATAIPLDNTMMTLAAGTYVVNSDVTYYSTVTTTGDVTLILADGARLYVKSGINSNGYDNGYDLTIYGQAAGSGELSLDNSIYCNNICINGGIIINNYNGPFGIHAYGNVTINDGTINIESGNDYGIFANGNVTINGGTLSFNSYYGIVASNVILASSTSLKTLNITRGFYVYTISLDRTFTVGKPATLMLPFYMDVNYISGGTFYTFGGVEKENDRWLATMNAVTDYIEPNTPYLVMPTETSLTFNHGTHLCTNGGGGGQTADEGSNWTFKGTYDYIKWTTDTSDPDYTAERAAEIGRVYGFAGVQKDGIEVGDFVKVASGARIRPMSAYLMWSDTPNAQNAPMRGSSRTGSAQELPQSITVRLLDASGTVTNVGEIDMETGEISFEGWYTLQGVKLEAEPTESGIYINNGKTVSIKK
ncbi:MAG: InlB B-repeat-containing protein [Bacteroidaceae bacterium]|nr:InlB B-repeat-containing protein [Bacteroidaceae bacterium]